VTQQRAPYRCNIERGSAVLFGERILGCSTQLKVETLEQIFEHQAKQLTSTVAVIWR